MTRRRLRAFSVASVVLSAAMACSAPPPSSPGSATVAATTEQARPPTTNSVFSQPNPWTADVSGFEPVERSAGVFQALADSGGWGNGNRLQIDFSIPVFSADATTPRMPVVGTPGYCYDGPDCDSVPAEMPVPADAYIEGSDDLSCDTSGRTDGQEDCHLLVVDRDARKLYETYQATRDGENLTALAFFVWDLDRQYPDTLRGDQCTSADAAGFPIAALTPTAEEVQSGSVDHALRFILPNDRMKEGVYVRPATHAGGPASTDPNAPPYGVRFRLRPDFDDSGYNASERVILRALKTHGMLLSDGGEIPLTFADDRLSQAKWSQLGIEPDSFADIAVDQFDIVDLGEEIPLTYDCVRTE